MSRETNFADYNSGWEAAELELGLGFNQLRKADVERCNTAFGTEGELLAWTPTDWGNALAGEVGEACNVLKKMLRIYRTPEDVTEGRWTEKDYEYSALKSQLADEIADAVIYADLLAARLGINLGEAIAAKFNEVSERVGSDIKLPVP